jgi:plastocyanin
MHGFPAIRGGPVPRGIQVIPPSQASHTGRAVSTNRGLSHVGIPLTKASLATSMTAKLLVGLLLLGVLLAGCSGSKGPVTPSMDSHQRYVIHMTGGNRFTPMEAQVPVNATVVWVNDAGVHNAFADDGSFKSPTSMPQGAEYDHQFTTPGDYTYVCTFHTGQGMKGTIHVG